MSRAIVMGGTRGTGLLIARELIKQQCNPLILARDVDKAQALLGRECVILQGDVTRPETLTPVFSSDFDALYYTVDASGGVAGRQFFGAERSIREVVYGGVVNTVDAARAANWQGRVIMLTTLGLRRNPGLFNAIMGVLKPGMIQASLEKAEYLIASGLDYTIVQAGALHDGEDSNTDLVITSDEVAMTLARRTARAQLARILLVCGSEVCASRQTITAFGGRREQSSPDFVRQRLNDAFNVKTY